MKFSQLNLDTSIQTMQREIEDKLADKSDVNVKLDKTTSFQLSEPTLMELASDGDEAAYDDGTNLWLYRRIGARLFKFQLTEV